VRVEPRDVPAARQLDAAECGGFAPARALAIATVASSTPDCSGVGHARIVFDVVKLVRGENITRVVASEPLHRAGSDRIAVGDTFVVAIEPEQRPAQTVHCVSLPAREGVVRHRLRAESAADAEQIVDAVRACR
jgi:hypothetical protein